MLSCFVSGILYNPMFCTFKMLLLLISLHLLQKQVTPNIITISVKCINLCKWKCWSGLFIQGVYNMICKHMYCDSNSSLKKRNNSHCVFIYHWRHYSIYLTYFYYLLVLFCLGVLDRQQKCIYATTTNIFKKYVISELHVYHVMSELYFWTFNH